MATFFPETGPYRRELYPRQMEFFEAGTKYRERCFMAANRVGKTEAGAYESTLHLTGDYPPYWKGKRFRRPVDAWAAGDTNRTVRDILQAKLLGKPESPGTGMIPGDAIVLTRTKPGTADAIEIIYVRHASGGTSTLTLKSYQEGRESFQGVERDFIWLDEEPPLDIYTECLLRTMTTDGSVMITFTPLQGLSEVVLSFLPDGDLDRAGTVPGKFLVMATWDDVPHLSDEAKAQLFASIPPYQRDARSKGRPSLGAGSIYPIEESEVMVPDFPIPAHWPRSYALDVGWHRTAAVWRAHDRETDTAYLYSEHYRAEAEPTVHAQSILSRGKWIPGCIDPAARGRGQADGQQLMQMYMELGLDLVAADNGVEAGIYRCWSRLSAGRLKVFGSLANWFAEYRLYRRDEKGKIVKQRDHLMDAFRYGESTGAEIEKCAPVKKERTEGYYSKEPGSGWMS